MSTSSGEVVLPEWQADSEVDSCPICGRLFYFLYRKHHCRRCGRIICDLCSPHRITLPRQYIVRSPGEALQYRLASLEDGDAQQNPALGGGEIVRVCNPCVPDPNYGPPPQHDQASPSTAASRGSVDIRQDEVPRLQDDSTATPSQSTSIGSQRHQPQQQTAPPLTVSAPPAYTTLAPPIPTFALPSRPARSPPPRHSSRTIHAAAVAEEDECPVCGTRNPPFGPGSDTAAARERHTEECISNHLAFTGPARASPASHPSPSSSVPGAGGAATAAAQASSSSLITQSSSSAAAQSSAASQAALQTPPAATTTTTTTTAVAVQASTSPSPPVPQPLLQRARPSAHRQRMLVYHATEKDCFDEDGEAQECVICFEEFQPGDEMARLECLCKFHRLCIREWWEQHWGSCPTHQLHE